jgi:hypothetical protein
MSTRALGLDNGIVYGLYGILDVRDHAAANSDGRGLAVAKYLYLAELILAANDHGYLRCTDIETNNDLRLPYWCGRCNGFSFGHISVFHMRIRFLNIQPDFCT